MFARLSWLLFAPAAFAAALVHAAGPVPLETGSESNAVGINNRGDIVGQYATLATQSAFLRLADGQIIDLTPVGEYGVAFSINDQRQVVGWTQTPGPRFIAFLWTFKEGLLTLGTLPNDTGSIATAINESGIVVGLSCCSFGAPRAFIWSASHGMRDLGTLVGNSSTCESGSTANAVNIREMVVGMSCTVSGFGADHAFLWTSESGMIDLGTLGGSRSVASGINDAGLVVGTSTVSDGHSHAFLWSRLLGMEDLGTLGGGSSQANAINDRGAVTGSSTLPDGTTHAFVWTPDAGMIDLGVLAGGAESSGADINSRGEVVGASDDASSTGSRAVYWPAPTPSTPTE
jgi:probable HAF family extracellular repeat protein